MKRDPKHVVARTQRHSNGRFVGVAKEGCVEAERPHVCDARVGDGQGGLAQEGRAHGAVGGVVGGLAHEGRAHDRVLA